MLRRVADTIKSHRLLVSEEQVLVALSGGADSVALLRVLLSLGYRPYALHCNFRLRGSESDGDEAFVRDLCRELSVPLRVKAFETRIYARERGLSIEMAARELRYGWFAEMRMELGVERIAVAHNADDRVETFLLNLSMGAGIRGLSGMPYRRDDDVIRPLMDCSRQEIEAYLESIGQIFRYDSSNDDIVYRRNLLRHQIVPRFREMNPSFGEAVGRTITQLKGVEAYYQDAIKAWRARVERSQGLHIPSLEQSPDKQALLFEILYPKGFSAVQIRTIAGRLSDLPSGRRFEGRSHSLQRGGEYLELKPLDSLEQEEGLSIDFSIGGSASLAYGRLEWKPVGREELRELRVDPSEALFDLDVLQSHTMRLTVRHRREGDKIYPYGMKGSKKLRRIFIDAHCSHTERERAYLLCLGDEPIWLVGMVADRRYRVTNKTERVIRFSYYPLGNKLGN